MRYYWHTELPLEAFKHVGDRRIKPQGGGGGIPVVSDVADAVGDVAGGVVDAASDVVGGAADVVSNVGSAVVDTTSAVAETVTNAASDVIDTAVNVVEKVGDTAVKAVDSIVQSAENDPFAFAANVALVATGQAWALPYFNAANAAAHGADLGQIAQTAATSFVAGQAGAAAGAEAAGTGFESAAQGAASGATNAALRGGDVETGALAGAINTYGNKELQNAVNAPSTSGGLPTQASSDDTFTYKPTSNDYSVNADYGLHGTQPGLQATLEPTTVPSDGSPIDYGFNLKDYTGEGLQPSESPNIKRMNGAQGLTGTDEGGTYSALGYTPFDASPNLGDPNSFINNPDVLGKPVAMTDTSWNVNLPKVDFAGALGLTGSKPSMSAPSSSSAAKPTSEQYGSPSLLAGNSLEGESTGDPYYLQHLRQLYGSLTPDMQKALTSNNGNVSEGATFMASGGSADSYTSTENVFPQATTGISRSPLMGGGQRRTLALTPLVQLSQQLAQRRAKGGSTTSGGLPEGHKPEFVTGHTGYYASGKGTGQSDDIPAVLQHGDFVMDADTVAALGDGSSKAGAEALEQFRQHIPVKHKEGGKAIPAQIADGEYVLPAAFVTTLGQGDNARGAKMLDDMRKKLREHKRSAPTSKIPPKAKSPLEYIKMGTKG